MEVDLSTVITLALGAVATFFGGYLLIAKGKLKGALTLLKLISEAVEDDEITKEELESIIAAAKEMLKKEKVQ